MFMKMCDIPLNVFLSLKYYMLFNNIQKAMQDNIKTNPKSSQSINLNLLIKVTIIYVTYEYFCEVIS